MNQFPHLEGNREGRKIIQKQGDVATKTALKITAAEPTELGMGRGN